MLLDIPEKMEVMLPNRVLYKNILDKIPKAQKMKQHIGRGPHQTKKASILQRKQ